MAGGQAHWGTPVLIKFRLFGEAFIYFDSQWGSPSPLGQYRPRCMGMRGQDISEFEFRIWNCGFFGLRTSQQSVESCSVLDLRVESLPSSHHPRKMRASMTAAP
jgi:hypothetical protein